MVDNAYQSRGDELAAISGRKSPVLLTPARIVLPMVRYRLSFKAKEPVWFTDFPGSAWRGALGHALRRVACTTQLPVCSKCPEYRRCAYPLVFETPSPENTERMMLYPTVPHPYVLSHRNVNPAWPEADRRCELMLTMIGNGNRHAATVVKTLEDAAAGPKGISGNRLRLGRVERELGMGSGKWEEWSGTNNEVLPEGLPMPPVPEEVVLKLITPLRVKTGGLRVGPDKFRFSDMFVNLMRRISALSYFHTENPLDVDFRGLADAAKTVTAAMQLEWRDMDRYSSRQETEMKLGGVVGQIRVRDANLNLFWPFLWLGQWTHGGTGATMGLGQYSIRASLQERETSPE